ncbi:MAG: hypothetical protein ALAOOOJD_03251 [bacterium]|nr:hypothetical protein [bacterium]
MTCDLLQRDDNIIGYVQGSLKPSARKRFEEHYFICAECFQALQRLEQIVVVLRHYGAYIFPKSDDETAP